MARILVVDDETNIRMMIRLSLQHVGYTVETASDGQEALEKFQNGEGWDLVILDQRMPGMEGIEVLKEMRRRNPEARIIMATAFGTIDLAVEAMKSGAQEFLRKPFTSEILRGAVQTALTPERVIEAGEGVTFSTMTINGFRVEFQAGSSVKSPSDFQQRFRVLSPSGQEEACTVILPAYLLELVKAQADREQLPGGDRFWQGLCEEALANYLWQNADFPPGSSLQVLELTAGLKRFVDAVLSA